MRHSRTWGRLLMCLAAVIVATVAARADDDDNPPPQNPGPGYEGILPNPTLPPGYVKDQTTSPWGVSSIFNAAGTSGIRLIQSFTPSVSQIDWVGFVIQNTDQGGGFGPTAFQVRLAQTMNSAGTLSNVLGVTSVETAAPNELGWLRFEFSSGITLTPDQTYYLGLEFVSGYAGNPVGLSGPGFGGRSDNRYSRGQTFRFITSQFGTFDASDRNEDLIFATGVVTAAPEPASLLLLGLPLALLMRRRRTARPLK